MSLPCRNRHQEAAAAARDFTGCGHGNVHAQQGLHAGDLPHLAGAWTERGEKFCRVAAVFDDLQILGNRVKQLFVVIRIAPFHRRNSSPSLPRSATRARACREKTAAGVLPITPETSCADMPRK